MAQSTVYRSLGKRRSAVPRHASAGTGLSTAFGRMLAKLALASDSLHASRPRRRR